MQKSNDNQSAAVAHRKVKTSTTLNRRYVKRPVKSATTSVSVLKSPKINRFGSTVTKINSSRRAMDDDPIKPIKAHPIQSAANARLQERKNLRVASNEAQRPSAKELKDQAIKKALAAASKTTSPEYVNEEEVDKKKTKTKMHFGFPRIVLALSYAAVAVFAIAYFVNLNMPDISLRVAAMQTGFDASYPGYVPRDYNLSGIVSEEGKIVLNFANPSVDGEFSLTEEKSSWDSNALLNNYIKTTYKDNYTAIKEQGLTIYISGNDAAWVNGGVVYKIKTTKGTLTKKQICSIAVSL